MFRTTTVTEANSTPSLDSERCRFPGDPPLAAGFVHVTGFLAEEAGGPVMDAAADSRRYKMEGDFQLC